MKKIIIKKGKKEEVIRKIGDIGGMGYEGLFFFKI